MKWSNKIHLKNYLVIFFLIGVVGILTFSFLKNLEYQKYNQIYNNKINEFINVLEEKYPSITSEDIIEVLNSNSNIKKDYLKILGIDESDSVILESSKVSKTFLILEVVLLISIFLVLLILFIIYERKKNKDVLEIIHLIEEINKKNYELKITDNTEDEFSILKNEIYKTTIMLKEEADNSLKDKLATKKSLEDISHQLKTPLTSILIMVDNLIENPDMEKEKEQYFVNSIRREVTNINFLVQNLLKLSKFDVNCINFKRNDEYVKEIIEGSINNVSMLCDLKNIKINLDIIDNAIINCDKKWQIEAITNILKNCIEYSFDNSSIDIQVSQNKIYTLVEIKDYGKGIDNKDQKHIFERFYKGKNSSYESIGIGLSLSKMIIDHDKGSISVKSTLNKGTTFYIKYYSL